MFCGVTSCVELRVRAMKRAVRLGVFTGTAFFGFVKDLDARGRGIADAKVVAEIKGGNASLVTRADAQGHYRITGFGKDVDPNTVEISCTVAGYTLQRAARRKLSNDPGAPVEIDCLM